MMLMRRAAELVSREVVRAQEEYEILEPFSKGGAEQEQVCQLSGTSRQGCVSTFSAVVQHLCNI
jgi:hypothetical protein